MTARVSFLNGRAVVTEGVPFDLAPRQRHQLERAIARVIPQLKPTGLDPLVLNGRRATIQGLVGTIALSPRESLEVVPKVAGAETDWVAAVVDLLDARAAVETDRRVQPRRQHRFIHEALADLYASRLASALRRDGPISIMERCSSTSPVLRGRLHVTRWVRDVTIRPHVFPVDHDRLTCDNAFGRAFAHVALLLGRATAIPRIRGQLFEAARCLRPGLPETFRLDPGISLRPLPSQYAAYAAAWSIARAVLSNRAILGSEGRRHGMTFVVEAWPLLESLLERGLAAAARVSHKRGTPLHVAPKASIPLLRATDRRFGRNRRVIPDGRLLGITGSVATFEAKYKVRLNRGWPLRADIYQALCTAAACRCPISVLVYPESFEPLRWDVRNMPGGPQTLIAIGLDLFGYRRTHDDALGEKIFNLFNITAGATIP